ncbi:kinesin-like protein [Lecanora helva]
MPSPFTSSFASAAAGNASREGNNDRNTGGGDWARARTNGATQTFRRSSTTTSLSQQRDATQTSSNPPPSSSSVYVPPHLNSNHQALYGRNGSSADYRYSKDQLLDMFRAQAKAGSFNTDLDDLLLDGWTPGPNEGINGGWATRHDQKDTTGPEICWDHNGNVRPMALFDMSAEEREALSTSVNSPLKPPVQNINKDGTPSSSNTNRRISITQNNTNTPSIRPGTRRRESGGDLLQSGNSLASPTSSGRFSKDEPNVTSPPPSLLKRRTDLREGFGSSNEDKEKEFTGSPFGSLKRTSTNPISAGLNGPSSPWSGGPQSAGFSPMGTFGNFAIGGQTPASGDKKPGFGSTRSESRFKGLMNAGNSEDSGSKVKEKASINSLEKLTEANESSQSHWAGNPTPQTQGADQDHYADDEDFGTGSAALGGDDPSPPSPQTSKYRARDRQTSYDDTGFSPLGLSSDMSSLRDLRQRRSQPHQQIPQSVDGIDQMNEPMSPTDTNPYQSPEGDKAVPEDIDTDDLDFHNPQYNPQFGQGVRGFPNQVDAPAGDRSQTSSIGANRGFPSLGSLGNLSGLGTGGTWSAAPGAVGTPSRAQAGYHPGFADANFGGFGDLTSPHGGRNGSNFFGNATSSASGNAGPIGRGSKLNSLLPASMKEPMRGDFSRPDQGFGSGADSQAPGFGLRDVRGGVEDSFVDRNRGLQGMPSPFVTNDSSQTPSGQAPLSATLQSQFSNTPTATSYFARNQEQEASSNQIPATQQRQMVMPDRMRWIYRDPQGIMQGPWSGLEMHDWYKAGFFSPELQVKKLEDSDYEPLAQLIRRIGNSREPFLVPQIGIPHGQPANPPNSSTLAAAAVPATTPSTAQPPFASSFPSFGTTLSAEQQNALERRKQEEQYLMARQKEHLQKQQNQHKMQQMQGGQLHHHSSVHSLHSQPSYGSITSPMGYQPSPAQGAIQPPASGQSFFDGPSRAGGPLGASIDPLSSVREDLPGFMERLDMGRNPQLPYSPEGQGHQQQVAAIMQERARLEREQQQFLHQRGDEGQRFTADRLEQYHQLRAQEEQQSYQQQTANEQAQRRVSEHDLAALQQQSEANDYNEDSQILQHERKQPEPLSLSEQVQKAAAKQPSTQPQSPWAKVDSGLPQPFPPPQSQSPMPAPTPQRNRQSVADALNAESQSPSTADFVETPSAAMAPWAKEREEASKGPSLKEIQAMEAKKAAQQEEIAAASRRAVAEQERLNQQSQPTAPAPGLPSSANWASSISPAIPAAAGASPWIKPATGKPVVATPVTGAKKTLAQIQKEEENKKNRQAAAQAAAAANLAATSAPIAGGKRYADLASKPTPLAPQTNNAAWTTVGAGGKVKTPTTPAPGLTNRTASGGIVQPPTSASTSKVKPTPAVSAKGPGSQQFANEEFQKWTKSALGKGLNPNLSVENFVAQLSMLPAEPDIISDSIYSASQTLDGRRFAEEFIRRRKLADRGIVPDSVSTPNFASINNANENKAAGGWSEVAKKGPTAVKEDSNAHFKVVGAKKKGGKR